MTSRNPKSDAPSGPETETAGFASPPCFMHELDPGYLGYLNTEELLDLLNVLLEGERAGARGIIEISHDAAPEHHEILADIARDEARYCAMLTRHIKRLGGRPSRNTGAFYDKLIGAETFAARLDLLDRGQGWVVRKLRESLPRIHDDSLREDVAEMLDVHERNKARCNALAG